MKTMLVIMIVVLLIVGTFAFTLPITNFLIGPALPSLLPALGCGANPVHYISCTVAPCPCPNC